MRLNVCKLIQQPSRDPFVHEDRKTGRSYEPEAFGVLDGEFELVPENLFGGVLGQVEDVVASMRRW